jgi:glycerol-3-phosphate cytidylyltransferase-like family protein
MTEKTVKVKVLKPIGYGGRVEKGEVIEMTEDYVKSFGPDYVVLADSAEADEAGATEGDAKELSDMTVGELREKAKSLDLPSGGSKADLIERIELAQNA